MLKRSKSVTRSGKGKTKTAVNISTGLLHVGKGVLLIDMEKQAMQQSPLNPSPKS
jgi:hypothetical protein